MIKAFCLVPFITFEYYLILFEHLFVDASHHQAHIQSQIEKLEYMDIKRQNMASNVNSRLSAAPASGYSVSSLAQNQHGGNTRNVITVPGTNSASQR